MVSSSKKTTKLHFARFEFKYILPANLRQQIEAELQYFLQLDPYVEEQPNHKYFVRSLYYDDPVFTCFFDKTSGLRTRSKFRVRTYTGSADVKAPVFLEIKGRHNSLVFKHRTPITDNPAKLLDSGTQLTQKILHMGEPGTIKNQFEFETFRRRIKPVALIDYHRRPYVSRFDSEFRLTFDEQLQATETQCLFPGSAPRCRKILPGYTVMEVKFRHQMPSWFHRIIQSFELRRVSISKICAGLEALEIVEDIS